MAEVYPMGDHGYRKLPLGFKDGPSQYFNQMEICLKKKAKKANPDKVYDTIDVEDNVTPDHYNKVVIKNGGPAQTWQLEP